MRISRLLTCASKPSRSGQAASRLVPSAAADAKYIDAVGSFHQNRARLVGMLLRGVLL